MSAVEERNREHVRTIAQDRSDVLAPWAAGFVAGERADLYATVVLDFLDAIRQYNLCLETTENAEAFAAKVREYLRTGPDAHDAR